MIKCNLEEACAVISRNASVKQGNDNSQFVSFGIRLPISDKAAGSSVDLDISVSLDGGKDTASIYASGRRVKLSGVMTIRMKDGKTYYNLRASSATLAKSTEADSLKGSMSFKGKISKKGVEERTDKNNNTFKTFSAFSSDKNGDKTEFTWVRFLYFNPKDGEDFLQAGQLIEASGDFQLNVYKGALNLECRVANILPWEPQKK